MGRAAGWLAASIHQALGGTQAEASCSGGGGLQVKHAAASLQSWSCCSGSEPRRRDDSTGSLGAEPTGDSGGEGGGSRWGRVRELVAVRVGPDLQLEDQCWSMGRPLAQGGERNAITKWSLLQGNCADRKDLLPQSEELHFYLSVYKFVLFKKKINHCKTHYSIKVTL